MSESKASQESVESNISATRARLDGHLAELRARTSPGQILDELMVYFRGREGAEFGRNLMDGVRSNPLPAAITGIGLTWLMASNSGAAARGAESRSRAGGRVELDRWDQVARFPGPARTEEPEPAREPYETETAYSVRLNTTRARKLGLARDTQETDSSFSHRVREGLAAAKQAASERGHDIRDKADSMTDSVQHAGASIGDAAHRGGQAMAQGGRAVGQKGGDLVATLSESPVLLGALGLAAGALLGALLPQSDREEAALGEIAGQASRAARSTAQEAVDRGAEVARTVTGAARESAGAHGLADGRSPGELVDAAISGDLAADAKTVAQDVLHTGDAAVRKQAIDKSSGIMSEPDGKG